MPDDAPADKSPSPTVTPTVAPAVTPLREPRDGVPAVTDTPTGLRQAVAALASGIGPVAIDAERASGYRYGQRAFLVQARREGAGTFLIDPVGTGRLDTLGDALADAEWILHAASQDLPCLAELGARPRRLFDTEHAGRLLGYPRVGLGPLVEQVLGLGLEKGHGAADWSRRPLPDAWLRYAALDVEVLLELREALGRELELAGKGEWAAQDFAAIAAARPPALRVDPWRRTSGLHRIRKPAALAVVRSMWWERDAIARERDLAPSRVLPDTAIIEAASAPASIDIGDLPAFSGRGARRYLGRWRAAVAAARALPASELPPSALPSDGPPPPKAWTDKNPAAAVRLSAARSALSALAELLSVPLENLLAPDTVRRLCWEPPDDGLQGVRARLTAAGARPWQIDQCADVLTSCLVVEAATP